MWYDVFHTVGRVLIGSLWVIPVILLLALGAFVSLAVGLFLAGAVLRLSDVFRGKLHRSSGAGMQVHHGTHHLRP